MNRRDLVLGGAGLFILSQPLLAAAAALSDEQVIAGYREKEVTNGCQTIHRSQLEAAVREVNPGSEEGLLLNSIGCRYPHKHVLFIPQRYLQDPSRLDHEADGQGPDGRPAKVFHTSHSFDMSDEGLIAVGPHQHLLFLTAADADRLRQLPAGFDKIAYQRLKNGQLQVGHVFHLADPKAKDATGHT